MQKIPLPKPQTSGGMPLMDALRLRQSWRSFSPTPLPDSLLSNLLWAACGVNRLESGKRTAPTARNRQQIDIYVARTDGLYRYDPFEHSLVLILKDDIRTATGSQAFVKDAPINLIFVSDYSRMGDASEKSKEFYSATDTGNISQNVYLFCTSAGLATVVRGMVDREPLSRVMGLAEHQKIILAQTVGYPAP
jgi:SagB-type dehydrogenase family enzyme